MLLGAESKQMNLALYFTSNSPETIVYTITNMNYNTNCKIENTTYITVTADNTRNMSYQVSVTATTKGGKAEGTFQVTETRSCEPNNPPGLYSSASGGATGGQTTGVIAYSGANYEGDSQDLGTTYFFETNLNFYKNEWGWEPGYGGGRNAPYQLNFSPRSFLIPCGKSCFIYEKAYGQGYSMTLSKNTPDVHQAMRDENNQGFDVAGVDVAGGYGYR